ncbi:MAG TPA: hypothetical protein VK601_07805, partial [Kofleriaceae bacterium]|nr:hypothetical protein [Kofleriaceae bacterium]
MTASALIRGGLALLLALSAACAGADKKEPTTPGKAKAGDPQAMNDFGDPANSVDPNDANAPNRPAGAGGAQRPTGAGRAPDAGGGQPGAPGSAPPDNRAGGPDMAATPNVTMPNYD